MKKIIVTGGAGCIGPHLVNALIEENYEVHVIDNLISGKIENVNPKAVFHKTDIRNLDEITPIIKGAQYVFHLAALPRVQYSIDHPEETHDVNVTGTLNVIRAATLGGVSKLIFSSSCAVYGDQEISPFHEGVREDPLSPYAFHKLIGEKYCQLWSNFHGLPTVCLRYFNAYGPGFQVEGSSYPLVIDLFLHLKKNNLPITITGDGEQTRDFVHVKDIVSANILAAKSEKVGKGEVINIGSGKQYSVNTIAKLIDGGEPIYIPARYEPKHILSKNDKARELLGWSPSISLEEGIEELKNKN